MMRIVFTLLLAAFLTTALSAQTAPAESPERVDRPALVFDSKRRKVVLFGASFGKRMQDKTWEYDGQAWVNRHIPGPPKRNSHCMVYDSRCGGSFHTAIG